MKVWLVVYFVVAGVWYPGEWYDGWGPVEYDTHEECHVRADFVNDQIDNEDAYIYARCIENYR